MKAIFYKNYLGKWTRSDLPATPENLNWIKKHKAENGVASIQSGIKKERKKK